MEEKLTKFLIGSLCILTLFPMFAYGQNISVSALKGREQELARLEDEWLSTYVSGDKAKYDQIVADDFTGIDESAVMRGKAEDKALLPAAPVPGGSAVNEDVRVRVYGDFSIVTGRIVTKFTADGREIVGFKTRFTDTWARRDGRWKVIARHYSRYPPERVAISVDPRLFSELAGKYQIAPGITFEISVEAGRLFGANAGQPRLEIHPESEFVYFSKTPAALYVFLRDRAGQISNILFIQDGRVIAAKRI